MAILWEKQTSEKFYQVRSAGRSVRLYTNGVFHSQFNPAKPVSGQLWDLLGLPAFFLPAGQLNRVLLLGVGGGAVIKFLEYFFRVQQIIGVDIDAEHLRIARRWFGVKSKNTTLLRSDAVTWIRGESADKFDLIIEDLFGDTAQDDALRPLRAIEIDSSWFSTLLARLSPAGLLVFNVESLRQAKAVAKLCRQSFPEVVSGQVFSHPSYDNHIAVFSRVKLNRTEFNANLRANTLTDSRRLTCRLCFTLRSLKVA